MAKITTYQRKIITPGGEGDIAELRIDRENGTAELALASNPSVAIVSISVEEDASDRKVKLAAHRKMEGKDFEWEDQTWRAAEEEHEVVRGNGLSTSETKELLESTLLQLSEDVESGWVESFKLEVQYKGGLKKAIEYN